MKIRNTAKSFIIFFSERGIKHIITVDPHTTNALKRYRDFIDFDIEVKNYLELVNFNTLLRP